MGEGREAAGGRIWEAEGKGPPDPHLSPRFIFPVVAAGRGQSFGYT